MYILGTSATAHWDLLNLLCTRLEVRIGLVGIRSNGTKGKALPEMALGCFNPWMQMLDIELCWISICILFVDIFGFLEMG